MHFNSRPRRYNWNTFGNRKRCRSGKWEYTIVVCVNGIYLYILHRYTYVYYTYGQRVLVIVNIILFRQNSFFLFFFVFLYK